MEIAKTNQKQMLKTYAVWLIFRTLLPNTLPNSSLTPTKNFLVENELGALNAIQSEMAATQDKNWVIIQEQLAVHEQNSHILRDCDQLLFANQQLNFNFDTVSSFNDSCQREELPFCFVRFSDEHFKFDSCFA